MRRSIYPGSFDPITLGHIDIIDRASKLSDELIVAVLQNLEKKAWFSVEERIDMIKHSVSNLSDNIKVMSFDGLLVDFAKEQNANIIVRGLRAVTDYEYEIQLAHTNRELNNDIDTIFLTTNLNYSYLSSSVVKEVATFNGDIHKFVNSYVENKIKEKVASLKGFKTI